MFLRVFPFVVVFALGASALAQQDDSACREFAWPLRRERLLFAQKPPTVENGASLQIGVAASIALRRFSEVSYVSPPERAPKTPDSFGAVLKIDKPGAPGLYQVTLSQEAWVDVVQAGHFVKASAFTGQRGCPGARKSLRFQLTDEPLTLQISGADADRLDLVVTPAADD